MQYLKYQSAIVSGIVATLLIPGLVLAQADEQSESVDEVSEQEAVTDEVIDEILVVETGTRLELESSQLAKQVSHPGQRPAGRYRRTGPGPHARAHTAELRRRITGRRIQRCKSGWRPGPAGRHQPVWPCGEYHRRRVDQPARLRRRCHPGPDRRQAHGLCRRHGRR